MRLFSFPRCRRAFTFVEISVAILVLSLAALPLVAMLTTETRVTGDNRRRIVAGALAGNIIERLRLEPLSVLSSVLDSLEAGRAYIESDPLLTPPDVAEPIARRLAQYERFVTVEACPGSAGRKGVLRALVRWQEGGRPRQLALAVVLVDTKMKGGRP